MYELTDEPVSGTRARSFGLDQAPEPGSFDALYQASRHSLYAYLRSRTRGEEEAADLTQQVYLQALRAWDRRPADSAAQLPWLFRIARNAATDFHRRDRANVPWETLPTGLYSPTSEPPETRLIHQEALGQLAGVVASLPPAKRDLLALRFAACLSYTEIAAVLGKREGAVKMELSRLLKHLREQQDGD